MRITKYYYPASRLPFVGFANRTPLLSLDNELDRLFETTVERSDGRRFAIDLYEDKQNTYLRADLPGVARDLISVEAADGILSIRATRKDKVGETETSVSFSRSVSLPEGVQAESVTAAYENGVLTVTLPKQEPVQPKKVTIAVK